MLMALLITATNLSRAFDGRPAVEELSFTVPEGTLCALLGPNGAGKTTTIRMLLGLIPVSGGSAEVAGIALPASTKPARFCGLAWGCSPKHPGFTTGSAAAQISSSSGDCTASTARPSGRASSTGFGASTSGMRVKNRSGPGRRG